MKKIFCDVCGKETGDVWKVELSMPISSYEDHSFGFDICQSCNRKLMNEIINKGLLKRVKEIVRNGDEIK